MNQPQNMKIHDRPQQRYGQPVQGRSAQGVFHNTQSTMIDTLSVMSGVPRQDIETMHDSGMSWRRVSRELGMNPGMGTGYGNTGVGSMSETGTGSGYEVMGVDADEMTSATMRNGQSGWAVGHGTGLQFGTYGSTNESMMSGADGLHSGMSGASGVGSMGSGDGMGGSGTGGHGSGPSGTRSGSTGSGMGGSGGGMHYPGEIRGSTLCNVRPLRMSAYQPA